jgi:hypothetical protein
LREARIQLQGNVPPGLYSPKTRLKRDVRKIDCFTLAIREGCWTLWGEAFLPMAPYLPWTRDNENSWIYTMKLLPITLQKTKKKNNKRSALSYAFRPVPTKSNVFNSRPTSSLFAVHFTSRPRVVDSLLNTKEHVELLSTCNRVHELML